MLRFGLALFGRSFVLLALLIGIGCSGSPTPQSNAADAKQQKQLQDLADEVQRLRQEVADKEVAEKKAIDAAIHEAEQLTAARRAPPIVSRPTDAELKRAGVLSSIEDLTFDDRKIATALYEKIDSNVLSLNAKEAEYATCGNGSSALAGPFAEGLLTILKQGVPNEHWIESNEFRHEQFELRRTQDNWHLPLILSAAAKLKLDDDFEIMSICRLCFSDRGTGLSKLNKHLPRLICRNPKERDLVTKHLLEDIKRERLFKHLLEDYLRWADSPEANQQQIEEEEVVKAAENEKQAKIAQFQQRAGRYATRTPTEAEAKSIARASSALMTRFQATQKKKPSYSTISGDMKKLVKASDTFSDRGTALNRLVSTFRQVCLRVYGFDSIDVGLGADERAKENATDALIDFDAAMLLIFPTLQSSDEIQEFLDDVESGSLMVDSTDIGASLYSIDVSDSLSEVIKIRRVLLSIAK